MSEKERMYPVSIENNGNLKKSVRVFGLVFLLWLIGISNSWAQCNCNFTIPAGSGYVNFDGVAKGVKGGDVICVNAGNLQTIQFTNVKGAAGNPVVIKNCGGQVVIGNAAAQNGMLFLGSKYIRVTGTGDSRFPYGFKIQQTASGSQGLAYTALSSDIEIDHMEITNTGYTGIMVKTDPSPNCADMSAVRPNFTVYNINIHDNYIHHTTGEGIYVGDSFYLGTTVFCGSTQYCHEVRGVKIYNNRFESTGRESIQVGSGVNGVEIYNNSIYNYSTLNLASQNGGVQLGLGTAARFYNNLIKSGTGPALAIQGIGNEYIYNNVFISPGVGGAITINTRPTPLATDIVNKGYLGGVYIINNTFVNATNGVVIEYINGAPENVLYNNLIVASATTWDKTYTYTDWKRGNNIAVPVLANAKFVNAAADDYRLLTGSPAINIGKDVSAWGVTKDADGKTRPSGGTNDAGAYEFTGSTPLPPVASAGSDKTITLPTNTTSITGSGTDPDGTITAYAWTRQSGPSATMTNINSATLSLSALVAGTYVFRLTVTDNSLTSAYDEVTLLVKPAGISPAVNAGSDQTITLPKSSVTLTGTVSDSDGTISAYSWTKQSGPGATLAGNTTATLNASGLTAGTYIFRLTVTDNGTLTAYDEVTLLVKPAGISPTVNAGSDQTITLPKSSVTLTGTASDSDGTISAYSWTKQSGPAATLVGNTTATLNASGLIAGTYIFRLTVTDNGTLTAYDEVIVTVINATLSQTVLYRINAGSPNTITATPMNWAADSQSAKSSYLDASSLNFTCGATQWSGTNTTGAPNEIFGPNRYSPNYTYGTIMHWNFPVASGTYEVNLFFAETPYAGGVNTSGARVFSVQAEGATVLSNFDIYATAGMNAVKKVFQVSVVDGILDINFIRGIGNPQVNGIEVVSIAGSVAGRVAGVASDDDKGQPVESPLSVYPNPFRDQINILFGSGQTEVAITLVNLEGQPVYQEILSNNSLFTIDLSQINIAPGLYILNVQTEQGKVSRKLLKE